MFRYIIFLIRYTVSILQLPRCWGTGAGEQKLFGGAGAVIYKFVRLLLQCSRAEIILLFNKYFTVHCTVRVRYPKSLPVPVFSVEDARKLISKPMIHEDIPVPVLIIIFLLQYPGSYYRYRTGMFCFSKYFHSFHFTSSFGWVLTCCQCPSYLVEYPSALSDSRHHAFFVYVGITYTGIIYLLRIHIHFIQIRIRPKI